MLSYEEKRRFHEDIARRMAELEPLRQLRKQKELIEHHRQQALDERLAEQEAERLRREIRAMGVEPCA